MCLRNKNIIIHFLPTTIYFKYIIKLFFNIQKLTSVLFLLELTSLFRLPQIILS